MQYITFQALKAAVMKPSETLCDTANHILCMEAACMVVL